MWLFFNATIEAVTYGLRDNRADNGSDSIPQKLFQMRAQTEV